MALHTHNFERNQLRLGDSFVNKKGGRDNDHLILNEGYSLKTTSNEICIEKYDSYMRVYLTEEEIIALYNKFAK